MKTTLLVLAIFSTTVCHGQLAGRRAVIELGKRQQAASAYNPNSGAPGTIITEGFAYANDASLSDAATMWTGYIGGYLQVGNGVGSGAQTVACYAAATLYYNTNRVNADSRVEITVKNKTAVGARLMGASLRINAAGTEHYDIVVSGTGDYELKAIKGGSTSVLQTSSGSLNNDDKIAMEVSGQDAAIRLKVQVDTGSGYVDVWTNIDPGASYRCNGGQGLGYGGINGDATSRPYDLDDWILKNL